MPAVPALAGELIESELSDSTPGRAGELKDGLEGVSAMAA